MTLVQWIASTMPTLVFAAVLWFGRKYIIARLTIHSENKIEAFRSELRAREEKLIAELRANESEIAALRTGALTSLTSRQVAQDAKRLDAIDQIWSSIISMAPAKFASSIVAQLNFDVAAKRAEADVGVQQMFKTIAPDLKSLKLDSTAAAKARPFVSPMTWALYSAYSGVLMQNVIKLTILTIGAAEESKNIVKQKDIADTLKAALPQYADYIDKFGESGYHYLLDELESAILQEIRRMLAGTEDDQYQIDRAAAILKQAQSLSEQAGKARISEDLQGFT